MTVAIPQMPEPSPADIARLEAAIGVKLPGEYLDFVRVHNGAKPDLNTITIGNYNESGVRCFIPVAEAISLLSSVEGFPKLAIPLAEDGCGNFFYVSIPSASVFFWDHELEGGDTEIAPTLSSFLSELSRLDASSVKLAPGQVRYAWINPSFKAKFD